MKHRINIYKSITLIALTVLMSGLFAIISPSITTHAASASLSASSNSVSVGSTVTFTVNVSCAESATSAAVVVSYGSKLELVSGEWLKSGLADFNTSTKQGALAFTSAGSMNGGLFRVTLRATSYDASSQSVNVNVIIRNGASTVYSQTVSSSVKITCASHNYGGWSSVSSASCTTGGREQRSCSVCGGVESRDTSALGHNWGSYSETKAPTCTATGTQTRTCSRCNANETKSVKATGHSYDKLKETKDPTCTETGEKTGTCKICGEKVTETIKATGHKYGEWQEVTAPTFSKAGLEKRICSECKEEETREIEALGYEFSEPASAKDSVFVYYDITSTVSQDEMTSKGYVNAKFAVPLGVGSNVKLYFVTESGALEEVAATVSEDGSSIEAQLTKLGTYVVCKILDGESDVDVEDIPSDTKDDVLSNNKIMPGNSNLNWIWIVIAGIEFLAIVGYVGYMVYFRRFKRRYPKGNG